MNLASFKNAIAHAFTVEDGRDEITTEDIALLDKIANFLVRRKLTVPAIMFLETMSPLNFVGSQIMTFMRPTLGTLLTKFEYNRLEKILEKRCSIKLLVERIEQMEQKPKKKDNKR